MMVKKSLLLMMVVGLTLGVAAAGFCSGPNDTGPEEDNDYS